MKALMSELLREILNNKQSAIQLKVALDELQHGNDKFNFVHNGEIYKVTIVKTPS